MAKFIVDQNECIGCGLCEQICPDIFELRDDGFAHVIQESQDETLEQKCDEAIEECPAEAIAKKV